jgi:CubicO group peptidase (beta-lactamase class C family)
MKNLVTPNRITLITFSLLMSLGSCTFTCRYVFLNVPDVYDYKKLPSRTINNDKSLQFNFKTAKGFNANSMVPFEVNKVPVTDIDSFLEQSGTTAFLIIRNDSILYERYFKGHNRETYCKSFSATKVFLSALIGAAIDDGVIQSVNDPVMKYIPEIEDKRLANLTIGNCLSLTSGIKTNNKQSMPWHDKVRIYYSRDVRKLMSSIEYDHESGKEFSVEEISPVLLGLTLERATGKSLSSYLEEKIWKPLGMEHQALWVTDRKKDGFEAANSGLTALPIDFAKFGRLYLNKGLWNGEKIISQEWIEKTTMPDTSSLSFWKKIEYYDKKDVYYNSMWWGLRDNNGEYTYSANGHFSQRIYLDPSRNLIIIRFGTKDGKTDWTSFIMKLSEKL